MLENATTLVLLLVLHLPNLKPVSYGIPYQKDLEQDAQLSQRDRAEACVIVFAKSRSLELGDNILRTL